MTISTRNREVFGYFENLNLLALLEDLRMQRTSRGGWSTGRTLCPIAHGLPSGKQVRELTYLEQISSFSQGCAHAAQYVGANPEAIHRFISCWDDHSLSSSRLLQELQEIWKERLENAQTMQDFLTEAKSGTAEFEAERVDVEPHF